MAKQTRNAEYTKEYNRNLMLRLLRTEPISRAELARRMGLTRWGISKIAEELIVRGVLVETRAAFTRVGRTPMPLAIKPDAAYAVGVYLNRDGCTVGLADMCGITISQEQICLDGSADNKLAPLIAAIQRMIEETGIDREKLIGIGVSAPGPLDGERGLILNPPHFELWHNADISPTLARSLGIMVCLENNASCLARYNLGKPETRGSKNFLLLLVDSGVGSGIVTGGRVIKGMDRFTSELGHVSIDYRGRPCACGNVGCLETYAAIPNLLKGSSYYSWKQVIDRAGSENEAYALMTQEAEYLSTAICTVTNMVSIDTVLLAGDLHYGAEQFGPLLEKAVNSRSLQRDSIPIRVTSALSGEDVRVLAAAEVAFDRYLEI